MTAAHRSAHHPYTCSPCIHTFHSHCAWTFLHSCAAYLPNTQGVLAADTKAAFVALVLSLRKVYACSLCRHHFDAMLTAQPVLVEKLKAITTRDDAVFWLTIGAQASSLTLLLTCHLLLALLHVLSLPLQLTCRLPC